MGYDDTQVAFCMVITYREFSVGISLSTYRMCHFYIWQRFAGGGIDNPALMVMESDILCPYYIKWKIENYADAG